MTITIKGRALHYVFKIANRGAAVRFFREILGMKVQRHEEYAEGCASACNGPYDSRWSKTILGYGPEETHFVLELVYNYPIKSYELGNDFIGIVIKSSESLARAKSGGWPILPDNILEAPGGFHFYIIDEPQPTAANPIEKIILASSNLDESIVYWSNHLQLQVVSKDPENRNAILGYSDDNFKLELRKIEEGITRGTGYGRLTFSCPFEQQYMLDEIMKLSKSNVLVPLRYLETPGKTAVRVMVFTDPDGHEVCIVDEESFSKLSQFQPRDEKLLDKYIRMDESGQLQEEFLKKEEAHKAAKEI